MKKDPRDEWQQEAIEKWYHDGNCRATIEAATGTGKSFVGKKVIDKINTVLPDKTIDVVVPSRYLKSQWEKEYVEKFNLQNVEVFVINTYATIVSERNPYLLILDKFLSKLNLFN